MEPMQDEDEERTGTLVNGRRFMLSSTQLVIVDSSGIEVSVTPVAEITAVRRGGSDVLIMKGQHDPVTLSFVTLGEAKELERELLAIMADQPATRSSQRRWSWKGRS